ATPVAKLRVATIFQFREFGASGGLMSYGTRLAGASRQAGVYVSRILKGTNASDLRVLRSTSVGPVSHAKTARHPQLAIHRTLLAAYQLSQAKCWARSPS